MKIKIVIFLLLVSNFSLACADDSIEVKRQLCKNWVSKYNDAYLPGISFDFELFPNDSCQIYYPKYFSGTWTLNLSNNTISITSPLKDKTGEFYIIKLTSDSLVLKDFNSNYEKHLSIFKPHPKLELIGNTFFIEKVWKMYKWEEFEERTKEIVHQEAADTISLVFLESGKGVAVYKSNSSDIFYWGKSHDKRIKAKEPVIFFISTKEKPIKIIRANQKEILIESFYDTFSTGTHFRMFFKSDN